mgnify:CR=1 FL=1
MYSVHFRTSVLTIVFLSMDHQSALGYYNLHFSIILVIFCMGSDDAIEVDPMLLDEMRSLAALKNIKFDDYITLLLEEEILKEITAKLVSDSSIY